MNYHRGNVPQGGSVKIADARRLLVERVVSSRYLSKSARLRDLLLYLSDRVVDHEAGEIHEQEVGHKVFGRPANYDTNSDNIVRVHASMLRKRLEQYFASEGAAEPLIVEIPKGNYAPVFRERDQEPVEAVTAVPPSPQARDWRFWVLGASACLFACSTALLLMRGPAARVATPAPSPTVALFWSQVFRADRPTDIVLDDAGVGLYQELTGRGLSLSEYFDRDYLRSLPGTAAGANLDQRRASAIVLRRQSSYASASFLWKLFQMAGAGERRTLLHFARDYSFRELKANSALLVGNSHTNPWVEPFEPRIGLRWKFDKESGVYYPVDTWAAGKTYQTGGPGDAHDGYCSIALLPNLGGTGNVLIVSGTGGSAINAGADFLADEQTLAELRRRLPAGKGFPHFEALIKVKGRSTVPRDATVELCRVPGG